MNNSNITETTNTNVLDEKKEVATTVATTESTSNNEKSDTTSTSTSVDTKESASSTEDKKTDEKKTDLSKSEMNLTHLNKDFVYELMSIPTNSGSEYRMVTFIVLWARRNGIKYEFDDYGNLYLTKGEIKEYEYYPCVTAHLDSVQTKQKLYALAGQELEVKTRIVSNKHEIYVDGMGIGGDDKAGILIGLSMFSHVDKLKACFFLEEETGCKGSNNLNTEWFKNVGYVIGYDSPDLNRAAWACSGVKLFNADFFKNNIQEICKKHGLTDFRSEPFTDVKLIREKTNIICMNFGSGYYNAHMSNEYCIIEDMDTACRMGHDIINNLGLLRYELEHKENASRWVNGSYFKNQDEDEKYFDSLQPKRTYGTSYQYGSESSYSSGNKGTSSGSTTSYGGTTSQAEKSKENNDETVKVETVKYIAEKYDSYIETIKTNIEAKCKELGVDFENFKDIFKNEIKF